MNDIDDRKKKILSNLVSEYIKTGKPVGSSSIVKKYGIGVSPATVRNEMAELEKLGYISQPHTSAGRVPTSKGYRFYVENALKNKKKFNIMDIEIPKPEKILDLREVLDEVSNLISFHTKEISLVLSPCLEKEKIKYIHFFSIETTIYLVLVTTIHTLEPQPLIEQMIEENKLKKVENFLNSKLKGLSFKKAKKLLREENFFREQLGNSNIIAKALYLTLNNEIRKGETREIYVKGIANLLTTRISIAEKKMHSILEMLEEKKTVEEIIDEVPSKDNVGYLIGEENKYPELWDYSLITVRYSIKEMEGTLALLGPMRMDYIKGIYVLEKIADKLEEFADKIIT
jgi:heat-inducible transcriptional repressor